MTKAENKPIRVSAVRAGSLAANLGIQPGDRLLTIGGESPADPIDYRFQTADDRIELTLDRAGKTLTLAGDKDYDADLGLELDWTEAHPIDLCVNSCIFCFVDQLPPGMRSTLQVKDDDYRYSVLHGNFVTLTNVSEADIERIIALHLSPLYISVHTTNAALRAKMMGNPRAADLSPILERLAGAGIMLHFQVVLCPGYNDGADLAATVADLARYWPQARSLGIVPVGLTRCREGLTPLRPVLPAEAAEVIRQVEEWQEQYKRDLGYPFVFAADEFYGLAGAAIPPAKAYADYPQLENGIGLVRLLLQGWRKQAKRLPASIDPARIVTLVTGQSAAPYLREICEQLNAVPGLRVNLAVVPNRHFGETITVAGLLTGQDIEYALRGRDLGDLVLVPGAALKAGETVFLDGMTIDELAAGLGVRVEAADMLGKGLRQQVSGEVGE